MTDPEAVFETGRLRLEPLRASHAPEMFELLSDHRLYRYIPRDPPPTLESLVARFERLETRSSPAGDEVWLNWVVRSRAGGRCLGRVEATLRRDGTAYLAYEIAPASWSRGFATEACRRVVEVLFEDYGATRIVAEVDTRNAASIRLLERLGFRRGPLRKNADFFKGSPSDEFTYTLTRPPGAGEDADVGATIAGSPDMDATWRGVLWPQFGAAIDMLENALFACPDELWSDRSQRPEFWYLAYHTLFFLDLYLSDSLEGFAPPAPFGLEELDPAGKLPERSYTKDELRAYLEHGRSKCRAAIDSLTEEKAREHRRFGSVEGSALELLLYNMRHVQHHAAQLNLILRQKTDSAPGWVTRAKDPRGGPWPE